MVVSEDDPKTLDQGTINEPDGASTYEYEYAFGVINDPEDDALYPSEIYRGGDVRLQLNGWFPKPLDHSGESGYVSSVEFHLDPVGDTTRQTTDLNPEQAGSGPFESPTISLSFGVGPFSVTAVSWDCDQQYPTVSENYNGETDHAYWRLSPQDQDLDSPNPGIGASVDFTVDEGVDLNSSAKFEAKSRFTWAYTPLLSGTPIYTTSDTISLSKSLDIKEAP